MESSGPQFSVCTYVMARHNGKLVYTSVSLWLRLCRLLPPGRYHRLPLPSEGAPMEEDFDAFVKILRVREHPVSPGDINHSTGPQETFVFSGPVPAGTNSPLQLLQPQFGRASQRRFMGGIGARHLDHLWETNGGGMMFWIWNLDSC